MALQTNHDRASALQAKLSEICVLSLRMRRALSAMAEQIHTLAEQIDTLADDMTESTRELAHLSAMLRTSPPPMNPPEATVDCADDALIDSLARALRSMGFEIIED